MIVVDSEGFSPKNYRKYNIRYDDKATNPASVDDYYMMKEVLSRRLKTKKDKEEVIMPDIIIVDGGRGQFNAVAKVLNDHQRDTISLMSVSKGKERNAGREIIHLNNRNVTLQPNDPLLFFIQRVRDEAHRFAITAHRSRRGKRSVQSVFDELPGIGPKRKKMLILHFGSIQKIRNASKTDLESVKGIPKRTIDQVYDFFHSH
jgi:excinuclease ABC subunit C